MDSERDELSASAEYPMGNYGYSTYIGGEPGELSESAFEAQTSALAARPGALLCDYLRVRLPVGGVTWAEIDEWLGERRVRAGGWRGWYDKSASVLEGGLVAWCSSEERAKIEGILVDLPGRACASMGARLLPFLEWALERGRITRIDFAIDDREGRVTRERILDAEADGSLVMRWRGSRELVSRERGEITGWCIYLGKRSAECMVRFYDKAAEQGLAGVSWVRCEMECKGKFGDALAREYFAKGSEAVIGQLNRRVRFVEPLGEDSNRWRWPVVGWWASFIGSIEPGQSLLVGEVPACTVSRLSAFVERCAGPSMATLLKAELGDLARLFGILERSEYRINPKQRALLERMGEAARSAAASAASRDVNLVGATA